MHVDTLLYGLKVNVKVDKRLASASLVVEASSVSGLKLLVYASGKCLASSV